MRGQMIDQRAHSRRKTAPGREDDMNNTFGTTPIRQDAHEAAIPQRFTAKLVRRCGGWNDPNSAVQTDLTADQEWTSAQDDARRSVAPYLGFSRVDGYPLGLEAQFQRERNDVDECAPRRSCYRAVRAQA